MLIQLFHNIVFVPYDVGISIGVCIGHCAFFIMVMLPQVVDVGI